MKTLLAYSESETKEGKLMRDYTFGLDPGTSAAFLITSSNVTMVNCTISTNIPVPSQSLFNMLLLMAAVMVLFSFVLYIPAKLSITKFKTNKTNIGSVSVRPHPESSCSCVITIIPNLARRFSLPARLVETTGSSKRRTSVI